MGEQDRVVVSDQDPGVPIVVDTKNLAWLVARHVELVVGPEGEAVRQCVGQFHERFRFARGAVLVQRHSGDAAGPCLGDIDGALVWGDRDPVCE